jgi:hypothetical protein
MQQFAVIDDQGSGVADFQVHNSASARPYDSSSNTVCNGVCVLVATVGVDGPVAFAAIGFT